jgi:hypothetical protein
MYIFSDLLRSFEQMRDAILIRLHKLFTLIDFGTTYSGYAFSSRHDFKKDQQKIFANQAWNAGSQRHFSLKTPTCLQFLEGDKIQEMDYKMY